MDRRKESCVRRLTKLRYHAILLALEDRRNTKSRWQKKLEPDANALPYSPNNIWTVYLRDLWCVSMISLCEYASVTLCCDCMW